MDAQKSRIWIDEYNYRKMRRISLLKGLLATLVLMLSLTSCQKEGTGLFKGYYSFKTSGALDVNRKTYSPLTDTTDEQDIRLTITPEWGQMNILPVSGKSDEMIVTMNIVGGGAVVFNATASGKSLTMEPIERTITVLDGTEKVSFDVTVSGVAEKYDDVIIFYFDYIGKGSAGDHSESSVTKYSDYVITASDVKCVAKEND